jgi:hypothetical protein
MMDNVAKGFGAPSSFIMVKDIVQKLYQKAIFAKKAAIAILDFTVVYILKNAKN